MLANAGHTNRLHNRGPDGQHIVTGSVTKRGSTIPQSCLVLPTMRSEAMNLCWAEDTADIARGSSVGERHCACRFCSGPMSDQLAVSYCFPFDFFGLHGGATRPCNRSRTLGRRRQFGS